MIFSLYYAMLCYAMLCYTILYNTILYYTITTMSLAVITFSYSYRIIFQYKNLSLLSVYSR